MNIDAVAQSQLLLAQGFDGIADILTNAPTMQTSTRDVITTLNVPAAVDAIQVMGGASVTDGEIGVWARATASSATTITSADGAIWAPIAPTFTDITVTGTASIATLALGGGSLTVDDLTVNNTITTASLAVSLDATVTGTITASAIITGDTRLHYTSANLSSTSGASIATLNNSFTAGDPGKWISIDDNGQVRWIPTWGGP